MSLKSDMRRAERMIFLQQKEIERLEHNIAVGEYLILMFFNELSKATKVADFKAIKASAMPLWEERLEKFGICTPIGKDEEILVSMG